MPFTCDTRDHLDFGSLKRRHVGGATLRRVNHRSQERVRCEPCPEVDRTRWVGRAEAAGQPLLVEPANRRDAEPVAVIGDEGDHTDLTTATSVTRGSPP